MLVLSRKLNEKIQIGEDVSITVLQITGNKVRIGIEAPQHVRIVRSELPPKQPTRNLTLVAAPAEVSSADAAFIPFRQTKLNVQQQSKSRDVESGNSSQVRLKEMLESARRRSRLQIVTTPENPPAAGLPMLS